MDDYEALKRIGELLAADLAAGDLASLAEYQARFPGHDDLLAREYATDKGGTSSPSGMNLELLTARHRHHYATVGEIARGGMGAIYHIRDETLRRDLAMKMVLGGEGRLGPSASGSQGPLARRFREEAQITAQLDHPGVVLVHELGADEEPTQTKHGHGGAGGGL